MLRKIRIYMQVEQEDECEWNVGGQVTTETPGTQVLGRAWNI